MRALLGCIGLTCYLLAVITFQPFRDVARGRAGQQALAGSPLVLSQVGPLPGGQAAYVGGFLAAASDVRRERPVELLSATDVGDRRAEYVLAPGTRLRDENGEIGLEGARFALAGAPTDYPYGAPVVAYGEASVAEVEVWALARTPDQLAELASRQTALLYWPWLVLALLIAVVGYLLVLTGTYFVGRALGRGVRRTPHPAGISLVLYLMAGFGLLGSAWAMMWPMVTSIVLAGVLTLVLARQEARATTVPADRKRRRAR